MLPFNFTLLKFSYELST
uniref:Uncharacterized protein n=1 Tax=Rhizophora mucronata TaxID=61149 RepID=A0A2P2NN87_RHIMU